MAEYLNIPLSDGFWTRSVGYGKGADATIGFGDRHGEIPGIRDRVQVANLKTAGRNGGFVDNGFALAHGDAGIAPGNAAHHRGIALLGLRQHSVVRSERNAAKGHTGEEITGGIAIANRQAASDG